MKSQIIRSYFIGEVKSYGYVNLLKLKEFNFRLKKLNTFYFPILNKKRKEKYFNYKSDKLIFKTKV